MPIIMMIDVAMVLTPTANMIMVPLMTAMVTIIIQIPKMILMKNGWTMQGGQIMMTVTMMTSPTWAGQRTQKKTISGTLLGSQANSRRPPSKLGRSTTSSGAWAAGRSEF